MTQTRSRMARHAENVLEGISDKLSLDSKESNLHLKRIILKK